MQNYTVKVPCRRYIYKYYTSLYGDILTPSLNDHFGDSIITKLSSNPLIRLTRQEANRLLKDMDYKLIIRLPIDYFYRIEKDLTDQHIYNLNRFLIHKFENDLFIFVNILTALGVERKKAIEAFCTRHNIVLKDDDVDIEAMQKKELRVRNRKEPSQVFLANFGSEFTNYIFMRAKGA